MHTDWKGVIGNLLNLISVCDRISNMGEAINVNSFNVNFSFPFPIYSAKMHTQKSFSHLFCKLSVPIPNEQNLHCLTHRNVPDSVLFHIHFTDSEYLDWFSRYKQLCELWYL